LVVQPGFRLVGHRVELEGPEAFDEVDRLSAVPPGVEEQRRPGSGERPDGGHGDDRHGQMVAVLVSGGRGPEGAVRVGIVRSVVPLVRFAKDPSRSSMHVGLCARERRERRL
jgi:hypothetical protein